jgi:uncharacterized membrane protein YbhN (UPF0104 family)
VPSLDHDFLRMTAENHTTRRRALAGVLAVALVGAGVYLLAREGVSVAALAAVARRADVRWLALAVAFAAACYPGYALLYQAVARLRDGPRIGLWLTLRLTVAVFGASVIATAAGRLGVEYWSLRKMDLEPAGAWARVIALNTAASAVLAAVAAAGATVLLAGGRRVPLALALAWILALPICGAAAVWLATGRRRRAVLGRDGRLWSLAALIVHALVLVGSLGGERRGGCRGLCGALLYWASECLVMWAALRAFGIHIGAAALVVGYATGYVSTMLPLPAGGVGGVEAASVLGLTLVGVPVRPALLAVLVQRVCTYWLPLAAAILSAPLIRRLAQELAAADRPAAARRARRGDVPGREERRVGKLERVARAICRRWSSASH